MPTESKKALEAAIHLIKRGELDKAKKLLRLAIEEDSSNEDAKIILAQLSFEEDPEYAAKLVSGIDESHPKFDYANSITTLSRLITSYNELAQLAKQNNTEAWQLYIKGINALKKRKYDVALESWIEALTLDRNLDDDGARKACVSLFKLLGNEHELTKKYHRRFTSALF